MTFIATFYSHFGAMRYMHLCRDASLPAKLMPVPRDLSSSCGTCVRYEADRACPVSAIPEETEQIVEITPAGYQLHYRAENS